MLKLLAFSGSLRDKSFNHSIVKVAAEGAQEQGAEVTLIRLSDYIAPLFNEDDEAETGIPEGAKKLKQLMIESDGFIIASPEYNSSFSAALKNAIDVVSGSITNRYDFKGTSANVELNEKDSLMTLFGDSDFENEYQIAEHPILSSVLS